MKKRGFTLIEILLVIILIGILTGVVVSNLTGRTEKGRIAAAKVDINTLSMALSTFELEMGSYPTSEQSLTALVQKPSDVSDDSEWSGPYIDAKKVPKDPWKREYCYEIPPKNGVNYDLYSAGPDGIKGNEDDITNWEK